MVSASSNSQRAIGTPIWMVSITVRTAWSTWRGDRMTVVLVVWTTIALAIPTLMQTKVPWYLNPFYPVFAIGMGVLLSRALAWTAARPAPRRRWVAIVAGLVIAASAAEARLIWYSFRYRDLRLTGQSLILAERGRLRGRRVFQDQYRRAAMFVAGAFAGADPQAQPVDPCCTLRDVAPGDYLLTSRAMPETELELIRSNEVRWLYRRRD